MNDLRNKLDRLFNNSLTEFVLIFTFVILVITFSFKAQRDEAIKQAGLTEQELVELGNIGKNISELEKKLGLEVSDQLGLSARISAIKKSIPKNFDINEAVKFTSGFNGADVSDNFCEKLKEYAKHYKNKALIINLI